MRAAAFLLAVSLLTSYAVWAQDPLFRQGKTIPDNSSQPSSSPPPSKVPVVVEVAKKIDATYPVEAVKQKLEGEVIIKVLVSEHGEVESAEIVSGNPVLAESALAAAKEWKFKTWVYGKYIPLSMWAKISFSFILPDMKAASPASATANLTAKGTVVESGEPTGTNLPPGVVAGLVIHKVQPSYPPEARRARVQGTVVLAAVIGKDGNIKNLSVISCDTMLVDAATWAVKQWRYKPYIVNGEPVEVDTKITVYFGLN